MTKTTASNEDPNKLRKQLDIANKRIHSLNVSHRHCSNLCVEQATRLAQLTKQLAINEQKLKASQRITKIVN